MAERAARIPNATRKRQTDGADLEPAGKRRGTGRTARGRQTRQDLLDAAQAVFERVGFLHARVADICAEAGISHGSFYTYFVSKEEVFNEIVDSVEFDLLTVEGAPGGADPVERIRAANRHYLEAYREHAGILRVIQQVSTFDNDVRQTRVQRQTEFAHAIEHRTRDYQNRGLIHADLDPRIAANALGGMVASLADQMFIQGQEFDFEETVEQLTMLWVNAVGLRSTAP